MKRVFGELVGNEFIITTYNSESGYIIPDKINQERKIAITIEESVDSLVKKKPLSDEEKCVTRWDFLYRVLGMGFEGIEDRYREYVSGLYSERDLLNPITWAEVAYLLYYVVGMERSISWNTIKPEGNIRVCVVQEVLEDSTKRLDERLAKYKSSRDMDSYIEYMVEGYRYIPLPMYCAFRNIVHDLREDNDFKYKLESWELFKNISVSEVDALLG